MNNTCKYTNSAICRFFVLCAVLTLFVGGCSKNNGIERKRKSVEPANASSDSQSLPGIIKINDLSGVVKFQNTAIHIDSEIRTAGRLEAVGKASWIDFEYFSGEKIRLKNGVIDIDFGKYDIYSGVFFPGHEDKMGPCFSKRIINIQKGQAFVQIPKPEQIMKPHNNFSTNYCRIGVEYGAFSVTAHANRTQIAVCSGRVDIFPTHAKVREKQPKWAESHIETGYKPANTQIQAGYQAVVRLPDPPQIEKMRSADMKVLSDVITDIKGSCNGS